MTTPIANPVMGTSSDETRPTALLIDDSPDVHRLLCARLRNEGMDLLSATTGEEGLAQAQSSRPSVILLDIDMPGIDGFEVLRSLKDSDRTLHIPVIMLSGLHNPQDKVTAFDLGAVDFVTKPFDVTELRVRVRSALRIAQLLMMLSQRAQVDGLTGLYNRAHFDKRWPEEVAGCTRHNRPLSLAMFDLDHFKSINDTYGHPAGDAAIQGLAKLLQRECRQSDIACRYGGEEFALIMPDTSPADAVGVCDRVRTMLQEITWPRHPERKVTCSIGIAGASGSAMCAPGQWVEIADRNLYRAKKDGRNRVISTSVEPEPTVAKVG